MAVRKTVSVKAILDFQEKTALRTDSYATREVREGVNLMTEHLLHDAGAYNGFMYLDASHLPEGVAPGIIRGENGEPNQYPDDSRRWYHAKPGSLK